ncbi:MAG: hypothetical protein OIN86_13560 [Candidatus Methanoperedens sp.]|nr:hypothetical protein [Candidatus Methanoperedens sp.]CAG0950459.1 hypothetical protein METP1_00169 [Methanosarcinales archaeon]
MRDGVRDRVNIPIDSKLKKLFEDLQQIHGISWTEVLEKGVRNELIEKDPVKILEYEIKIEDEKQDERRQALIRAKANISVLGPTSKVDPELEKKREENFQKDSSWLPRQIINGDVNWSRIFFFYQFESKKEALAWFRPRIAIYLQQQKR